MKINYQTPQLNIKPLVYNTTKNSKQLVHFYLTKDVEPAWKDTIKIEEIEIEPQKCLKCGCLLSPTVKNIHTHFGYSVSCICPNCGINSLNLD